MKMEFEGTIGQILDDMEAVLSLHGRVPNGAGASLRAPRDIDEIMSTIKTAVEAGPSGPEAQGPGPQQNGEATLDELDPLIGEKHPAPAGKAKRKHRATKPHVDPAPELPEPEDKPALDPKALVAVRQQTIDDLQAAYASGKQQQVFDLLSKYGNGAKSFRELDISAFPPIRDAIDAGALA